MKRLAPWLLWTALLLLPREARAFCGFYVAGADSKLYANASMVVLMRDGTRTVLAMQNNYQGPPAAFALVIPVPSVLRKEQVKTLPREIFERVDALGAPRLVEYWEVDPCRPDERYALMASEGASLGGMPGGGARGVKVEARFAVGEYDIVILSAQNSNGLEGWLHDNHYNVPGGAAAVLAPYVAAGTKFFVAKVDPARVKFERGQALLSPLRFHYDSPDFSLPIRLGLLNSQGQQDLIVNILAADRYQVANHPNVLVPTNLRVADAVRDGFASFYEALFARTTRDKPGVVVTEYAWDSSSCDPCPTPPLTDAELLTLGADVLGSRRGQTLTRLHYRYTRESLGEDLIFERTGPVVGGRGVPDANGRMPDEPELGAGSNAFQGRYAILHPWQGEVKCETPQRGRWGDQQGDTEHSVSRANKNAALRGEVPRAGDLAKLLVDPPPALAAPPAGTAPTPQPAAAPEKAPAQPNPPPPPPAAKPPKTGCAVAPRPGERSPFSWLLLAASAVLWRVRRRVGASHRNERW